MAGARTQDRMNLGALLLLSLGHLITDLSQGALPMLLPFLKEAFGLSYAAAGAIVMTSNLTSSLVQPAFGYYSDRHGAVWMIPTGIAVSCVGFGFLGLAPNYPVLLAIVFISGLGVAGFHPEGFKAARFFTGDRMATGMSYFSVGGNLGFGLGPLLAIWIHSWLGLKGMVLFLVPGLIAGGIFAAALGWLAAPQRAREKAGASQAHPRPAPLGKRRIPLIFLILAVSVRSWVQMGLMAFIPFYFVTVLKGDPLMVGKLLTVFLVAGAIGTLVGAPVADRVGHKRFFVLTMVVLTPLLWLFLHCEGWWYFLVLGLVGAFLVSTFSVTVVMAQQVLPDRLGMAAGLMVGFAIGMGGIGAAVLGSVADTYGVVTVLRITALLPIAAALAAAAIPYPPQGRNV